MSQLQISYSVSSGPWLKFSVGLGSLLKFGGRGLDRSLLIDTQLETGDCDFWPLQTQTCFIQITGVSDESCLSSSCCCCCVVLWSSSCAGLGFLEANLLKVHRFCYCGWETVFSVTCVTAWQYDVHSSNCVSTSVRSINVTDELLTDGFTLCINSEHTKRLRKKNVLFWQLSVTNSPCCSRRLLSCKINGAFFRWVILWGPTAGIIRNVFAALERLILFSSVCFPCYTCDLTLIIIYLLGIFRLVHHNCFCLQGPFFLVLDTFLITF